MEYVSSQHGFLNTITNETIYKLMERREDNIEVRDVSKHFDNDGIANKMENQNSYIKIPTTSTFRDVATRLDEPITSKGKAISFEIWVKYLGNNSLDGYRGWVMGYDSGWGPYVCLNDERVNIYNNKPNIGVTPGYETSYDLAYSEAANENQYW